MDELGEERRKANLRLECLRLAVARSDSAIAADIVDRAAAFADFVLGSAPAAAKAAGSRPIMLD